MNQTAISSPATFMSIWIALLVAPAIFESIEVAVAVGVWILASTRQPTGMAGLTFTSTADGWTPASEAIAGALSVRTLKANEEMSPAPEGK